MKNKVLFIASVIIAVLVAGFFYNKYRIAPDVKPETLKLMDLEGNEVSPTVFNHKKLLLNFFATWCGPCVRELPSLDRVETYFSKEDFKLILISDEPVETLRAFKQNSGLQLTILHSESKLRDLKIYTLPTSYLINAKHEIVFKKTGEEDWAGEAMLEKIKSLSR
jgi:peroxiredoxin